jgi:hypothetical protein
VIKVVEESHLVTTPVVQSPGPSALTALTLSHEITSSPFRVDFLHCYNTFIAIRVFNFNGSDYSE